LGGPAPSPPSPPRGLGGEGEINGRGVELKQNYPREVTEKQGGNSYFNILTKISAFFTVNLYTRTRYKNNKVFYTFMIISHNSRSHEIAIAYFDKFPLLSNKALDYAD
jgi:hypothetical protein